MKNVPLNQFIGLPFRLNRRAESISRRKNFSVTMVNGPQCAKNSSKSTADSKGQRTKNQKSLPVWWVVMYLGFENWQADYLVDWWGLPKPFFLRPRPGVCFDSPFFREFKFLAKKLDFFQTWGTSLQSNQVKQGQGAPPQRWPQVWENIKYFLIFLPPDSLALLLQRGFLSCTEPRWFERFFRG